MRRIASILLAFALLSAMAATGFAATAKITKQTTALDDVYAGEVSPGTKIFLILEKNSFEDSDGNLNATPLTAAEVRSSGMSVKYTAKSGPKAIESVEIKENSANQAGVLVTLASTFTSTKPLDFEATITLYIGSKRQSHTTTVSGTLANDEEFVYSDTDYIDLSEGVVAVCEESATRVEAYIGNDVTMFVRMVKGKSYAGYASTDPTDADIEIFDEYPDVVNVYRLSVSGLTGTGKIVQIDPGTTLYVYDGDLNYLGTTDDLLAYSDVYYTSLKKLDVIYTGSDEEEFDGEDDEFEGEFEDDYEPGAESDLYPDEGSENDVLPAVAQSGNKSSGGNPDTGVSPLLGFSVAAGVLSLAAMGASCARKRK